MKQDAFLLGLLSVLFVSNFLICKFPNLCNLVLPSFVHGAEQLGNIGATDL